MKRFLTLILACTMLLTMFVSCEKHDHEFDDKWSKDSDYHWHECTAVDGCDETKKKEKHDFVVEYDDEGKPVNVCSVCGYKNSKVSTAPEHEHVFADSLEFSDNYHWYPCTVENCYEMSEKTEHAYSNPDITYSDNLITITYTCVDCGYEEIETQTVKTEVDNAVSWDDAFKNFKLTNFSMDVYFREGDYEHVNHCVVTETEAYYCIPDSNEFYTVPNGDGTYTTYRRHSSEAPFTKLSDTSDHYLKGAQVETVIQVSFEDNFDKFTYDEATGSYVCEEVIVAEFFDFNGNSNGDLYCFNNVVKITNGQISYIEASYYFNNEDRESSQKSFKYYNIGMSAVEIPQSVIDNAIIEGEN